MAMNKYEIAKSVGEMIKSEFGFNFSHSEDNFNYVYYSDDYPEFVFFYDVKDKCGNLKNNSTGDETQFSRITNIILPRTDIETMITWMKNILKKENE